MKKMLINMIMSIRQKNIKSSLLKIYKKSYKNIGICNIGYTTTKKIDDYENIYSLILCICRLIMQTGILKKKMEINT